MLTHCSFQRWRCYWSTGRPSTRARMTTRSCRRCLRRRWTTARPLANTTAEKPYQLWEGEGSNQPWYGVNVMGWSCERLCHGEIMWCGNVTGHYYDYGYSNAQHKLRLKSIFFSHSQTRYFHCYGFGVKVWSLGLCIMVAGEVISLVRVSVSHRSDTVT